MGLKKLIYKQADEQAQTILIEAKEEKEALLEKLNKETDKKISNLISNAKKENNKKISSKKLEFEHEQKRIILDEKNTQIERVLTKYKETILNLTDKQLFDYTVKLI